MADIIWKVNGIFKADAEKCYAEIQKIGEQTTPKQILEYAKDENTELHKCFDWNDETAAEKYRLIQAGNLVRNLVFVPKTEDKPTVRVLSLTKETSTYQPTRMFLKNEDEYENLLKRALLELEMFKRKYATLSELESVFEQIDLVTQ